MFQFSFILFLTVLPAAFNQLISFKDGKIGVNFAGYHAEAGLGGLLTGNGAHGGLSASAGTPFGQQAGAGIGGTVDNGQSKGGAYAGASAGYGVGASAALGGNVDERGSAGGTGAEAHARGISTKTVKLSQTPPQIPQQSFATLDQRSSFAGGVQQPPLLVEQPLPAGKRYYTRKEIRRLNRAKNKVVQVEGRFDAPQQEYVSNNYAAQPQNSFDYTKFFDFGFFSNAAAAYGGAPHPATQGGQVFSYQKQISPNTVVLHNTVVPQQYLAQKTVEVSLDDRFSDDSAESEEIVKTKTKSKTNFGGSAGAGATTFTSTKHFQPNPNFFNDIFNIPISTLGAVSQFLSNGVANGGGVAVTKTKTIEHS